MATLVLIDHESIQHYTKEAKRIISHHLVAYPENSPFTETVAETMVAWFDTVGMLDVIPKCTISTTTNNTIIVSVPADKLNRQGDYINLSISNEYGSGASNQEITAKGAVCSGRIDEEVTMVALVVRKQGTSAPTLDSARFVKFETCFDIAETTEQFSKTGIFLCRDDQKVVVEVPMDSSDVKSYLKDLIAKTGVYPLAN